MRLQAKLVLRLSSAAKTQVTTALYVKLLRVARSSLVRKRLVLNTQPYANLPVNDSKQDSNRPVASAGLRHTFDQPILPTLPESNHLPCLNQT
jgi:hypothetical protein